VWDQVCQDILAEQCSLECLEEFGTYTQEYQKCFDDCIDKKIDECLPLPPYELDFAEESLGNQTFGKFVSMSPKKQFLNGIESKNAICKEGLELILKSSSNSYACVEPKSVIKLVERGWGIDPPQKIRLNDMRCWSGAGEWRKYYFDVTIINLDENKSVDMNDLLVYVDGEEIRENQIRNSQNEIKPNSKISVGINYEEGYFFDHVVDFRELRVIGPSNTAIDVWPCWIIF